jgi:S-phase kinase-associated protein 1
LRDSDCVLATSQVGFYTHTHTRVEPAAQASSVFETMGIIKLKCSDDQVLDVDFEIAKHLGIIKTMFEDLGIDDNDMIPLHNVNSDILNKVLCWVTHHKDDIMLSEEDDVIPMWDIHFLNSVDQNTLFDLIMAANYLDIKGLLHVTCKIVSNMLKCKTTGVLLKTFTLKDGFSPVNV